MTGRAKINIARSLRLWMAEKNINQRELAESADISPSHLSVIMSTGSCSTVTLQKLADGMDILASELLARGEQ